MLALSLSPLTDFFDAPHTFTSALSYAAAAL
jgi:hypothetical protein